MHAPYWYPNYSLTIYLFCLIKFSLAGLGTIQVRYTYVCKVFVNDIPPIFFFLVNR